MASQDSVPTTTAKSEAAPSKAFGAYRLLQQIGEGGMGEVWLAEQTTPVHRQVALKVIKAGMDTAHVVARFEAERQALAMMDHPAIATVFDGGTTPEGRPYFAMEYVKGEPITTYCDRQRLTTTQRLELFIQVCEGVQHAHQKGVIHRDLKPSNVLVTIQGDRPVPKIIDFGIAKATAQHLTERTLFTELGILIGTPEYMSPEQAEMGALDIDTRTDVYALGVMLYELLTGALPFDRKELRQAGLAEIQRIIREKEPPRPSTRVTQIGLASTEAAKNRQTEVKRLVGQLRGDLDWITMKALEKDRTRRYETVNGLASDVRRHLKHEPVVAGPPSTVYRAKKFARRHRFGVGAATALVLLLVAFGVAMAVQAQRIARERDRANREAARASQEAEAATQVTEFMAGLFKVSNPSEARGNTITAREVLDNGVARIDADLASQPLIQARLMDTMGRVYRGLGLYERAETLHRRALAGRERLLGGRDPDTLQSWQSLGLALMGQDRYTEAERCFREAFEGRRDVLGRDHVDTLRSLTSLNGILFQLGRWADAESGFREILEARERTLGRDDESTLNAASNLGAVLHVRGKLMEAETLYRRAFNGLRDTLGADHPDTLSAEYNLGTLAEHRGSWREADAYYSEVLKERQRVQGADHDDALEVALALADVRKRQGQLDTAEALVRDVLERARRALPRQHEVTTLALVSLGNLLNVREHYVDAQPLLQEGLDMRRALSPHHWRVAAAQCELGRCFRGLGRFEAAEPLLVTGCQGVLDSTEPPNRVKREAVQEIVALYDAWDKPDKAAEWRKKVPAEAGQSTPAAR